MADSNGTGAGAEADPNQGVVPPGESKGEGKPPGDDWIKKSQFVAALNSAAAKTDALAQQNADLQRQLNELKTAKATPPEPTRDELRRLVEAGEITQAQADTLTDKQQREQVRREASETANKTIDERERSRWIEDQLSGYRQLVGEAWVDGSAERVKAEQEYRFLIAAGSPATKATEAAALRAAFGDLATLRASKTARSGSSETHSETGGGKPTEGGGGGKGDILKDLTPRERRFYEDKIRAGVYANWDAVREERKFARPRAKA